MSVTDEIAKLNELKDSGAITEEEFAEAKAELLKQIAVKEKTTSESDVLEDENMWGMFIHLSQFAGYVVPFLGYVLPIVLWQINKDKSQVVDMHGKNVTNWIISAMIYGVVSGILCAVVIGIPMLFALGILCIIFPIMGAIKANNGIVWQYPMAIKFFK
ncbi:MAG: DUF4870 domain-containing protein [Kiritimatiellae bacterium]|jgi:uncharacterized Tic20 family protein|nr:DUF4870 domain-containing protein [Kiritimatiellia bacterium]